MKFCSHLHQNARTRSLGAKIGDPFLYCSRFLSSVFCMG